MDVYIIFNAINFTICAGYCFVYFFSHSNSKHNLALYSCVVLSIFAYVYIRAAFGFISDASIGPDYLRKFVNLLAWLPIILFWSDWRPDRGIFRIRKHKPESRERVR